MKLKWGSKWLTSLLTLNVSKGDDQTDPGDKGPFPNEAFACGEVVKLEREADRGKEIE